MKLNSRIFIAGHNGLVKFNITIFKKKKFKNIFVIEKKRLDLRNQSSIKLF